jgi:Transposase DDE domain
MDARDGFAIGSFGDARRAAAGAFLFERIVSTGSLVVRRLGVDRAGELSVHRFLSSPAVTLAEIAGTAAVRTAAACRGRRVVAVQDTSEVDFTGRDRRRRDLGANASGGLGFYIHPLIAVDRDSEAVLGVLDIHIWTRGKGPAPDRHHRPLAEKESHRWLAGTMAAADRLGEAASVVVVMDREGDLYPHFARRPAAVDLIVRARHDRALAGGGHLFAAPESWPELGRITVRLASRGPGDPGRSATLALRARAVVINRPAYHYDPADPETLSLTLVEAREIDQPPHGERVCWRLLTTVPVASFSDAEEVVGMYRLRWRIEQVFRATKNDGLRLEDTQVQKAQCLFKLAALAVLAATRIIQLVDARDGSTRPASDVIDAALLDTAAAIGRSREGATPRQQNPHPHGSLAWLAWIIARLGGWNCYYKPPGPKTMRLGWNQFAAIAAGFTLATVDLSP